MRVVFLGTADFAVPSLRAVARHHDVAAVVTQPDRAGSRGAPAPRPVAEAAAALGLPVLRPARLREADSVAAVLALEPDALVVAAYGQIVPVALLDGPRHGGINVHGSLLPRWRGASPIAAAILAGDEQTGVSIMRMDAGVDTGPVYASRAEAIHRSDTTPALTERLAGLGAVLLPEVLVAVEERRAEPVAQDGSLATSAPRLSRADADVEWGQRSAVEIDRHVRAMIPWPGTMVALGGQRVRLLAGEPVEASPDAAPGEVLATRGESVDVATAAGVYRAMSVQPPGGRPMSAAAYLRGRRNAA